MIWYQLEWPLPSFKDHNDSRKSKACVTFYYRLVGLVVKASASRVADPSLIPAYAVDDFQGCHTSDSNIGTPMATLPGARVSARNGRPGANIRWIGELETLICIFYLGATTRTLGWADPSLRYTSMLLRRKATNKQANNNNNNNNNFYFYSAFPC